MYTNLLGGGGKIGEEFNKDAFIDCNDFSTTMQLLEFLTELEYDRTTLDKILAAPIFLKEKDMESVFLEKFLKNIIDKTEEEKIRRLSAVSGYARKQEQMYLRYAH